MLTEELSQEMSLELDRILQFWLQHAVDVLATGRKDLLGLAEELFEVVEKSFESGSRRLATRGLGPSRERTFTG